MDDRNPQAEQMAHESMVRNLAAQASAIWPQELPILRRHVTRAPQRVLDVACGTGEITVRLADLWPEAELFGVDLVESHLELARTRAAAHANRVHFEVGDAFALAFPDDHFDLVVCRHFLQAVPDAHLVIGEIKRVTRPGGRVHVVAEDYSMMYFHPVGPDTARFWDRGPIAFVEATGCDLNIGRKTFTLLHRAGFADVTVDWVIVDTERVPRETFAAIWEAWRDGYSDVISEYSQLTPDEVARSWAEMLDAIRSPEGYGVWHLPVISARLP